MSLEMILFKEKMEKEKRLYLKIFLKEVRSVE